MDYFDDAYKQLAAAIVLQAIDDFKKAAERVRSKKGNINMAKREMQQVVSFVKSSWFSTLTDIDPEIVLNKLKEELL